MWRTTSDHRFMANCSIHDAPLRSNLLIRLRRTLPEVPPQDRRRAPLPDAERPARHRRASPRSTGHIALRLIKVAAEMLVSCRRVLIRLSSAWPGLPTWRGPASRPTLLTPLLRRRHPEPVP
ncbi:MAG: hypothetical protein R3C01_12085 [Planctomycetaceae bacterium]